MYYPYFRGKQFDLITLRECAGLMADAGFIPIVEPVKESLVGLKRSIDAINEANGEMVLIVNPSNGEHASGNFEALHNLIQVELKDHGNLSPGMLLTLSTSITDVMAILEQYPDRLVTLIHSGFASAKTLADYLASVTANIRHIFIDDQCGVSYTKHFKNVPRVLIRNGFERRANRAHPEIEKFSELHATFGELGMDGFGDFLIVGDEFSVAGGPAYAVAIHMTCIDPEHDDVMLIHHFKSIRYDTPTDPAGKFAEAVQKLVDEVNRPETLIFRTKAVDEFFGLHLSGHFPGLGYVKKLSMNHHIETMAEYFKSAE